MIININNKEYKQTKYQQYFVSKEGKVISVKFNEDNSIKTINFIKNDYSQLGYARVPLKVQRRIEKKILVHRLAYDTWKGFENENNFLDHIDANPRNNHIDNLRECTQKQNIKYSMELNRFGHNANKHIQIQDKETKEILNFDSVKELRGFLGLSTKTVQLQKAISTKKFKNKYDVIDIG